ncbi:unnamed protein product [Mortierella alpina]
MDLAPYPTHPSSATNTQRVLHPSPRDPAQRLPSLPSLSSLHDPLAESSAASAKDMHRSTSDPLAADQYAAEHMDVDAQPPTRLPFISAPLDNDLRVPHRPPTSGHGVALHSRLGFIDQNREDRTRNPPRARPPMGISPLSTLNGRASYSAPSAARGEVERDRALQRSYQERYPHQHHSPPPSPTREDRSRYAAAPSQAMADAERMDPSSSPPSNARDRALPSFPMESKNASNPHVLDRIQRSSPSRQPDYDSGSHIQSDPRPRNSVPSTAPPSSQQHRLNWEHAQDRPPDNYYSDHATARDGEHGNGRRALHAPVRLRPIHHEQHSQSSEAQDQHYLQENLQRRHSGSLNVKSRNDEDSLEPAFPHHFSQEARPQFLHSHPKSYYTQPALSAASHSHISANAYSSPPLKRIQHTPTSNSHPVCPGQSHRVVDGSTTQDSSYDSNIDDDDSQRPSAKTSSNKDYHFKFGTDMPSTVDLRSAVECCEALCKFALHYSEQPSAYGLASTHGSSLEPNERATLQNIRKMNTRMLIGLHDAGEPGEEALCEDGEESNRLGENSLLLGQGPPSNEMVHEFAKAATSIFQLAVRIKAWVGKSPEERQVDEEINIIRAKRCLLMDSTLVVPTVDQHGNVQNDFVQASTSISKSFHERQRELEQQRQQPAPQSGQKDKLSYNNHSPHTKYDQPQYPSSQDMDRAMDDSSRDRPMVGFSRRSHSSGGEAGGRGGAAQGFDVYSDGPLPMSSQHLVRGPIDAGRSAFSESRLTNTKHHSPADYNDNKSHGQGGHSVDIDQHSNSGSINGASNSRSSKNSDVPHQKYRKRAKRTQPPGRCLSCDSSDTPEWRRGPDGARTLCNACGLHYAKLLKRQSKQQQVPQHMPSQSSQQSLIGTPSRSRPSSRSDQLQVITFPLTRPASSLSSDPGSETTTSQNINGSGSRHVEGPKGASKSPPMAQHAKGRGSDASGNEDQVMKIKEEA